jgi:hypothetical protein
MQRTLFFFILYLALSNATSCFAQDSVRAYKANIYKQSLAISYGAYTPDYLLDGYRPGRPTEFDYTNKGTSWVVGISYKYQFLKRAYIGFTATAEQQYGDWLDNEIPGGNVFDLQTSVKGAFVRTAYTLAPELRWDYLSTKFYSIYTVLGVGVTYEFETDQYNPPYYNAGYQNGVNEYGAMRAKNNKSHLNGYYAPLGFEAGRRLSFFAEFGFGYKGVFNSGLSCKF